MVTVHRSALAGWMVVLGVLLSGCAGERQLRGDAQQGTVVDAHTGKPIANAIVVAAWTVAERRLHGRSGAGVAWIDETTTDDQGRFSLPAWGPVSSKYPFDRLKMVAVAPGYQSWIKSRDFPNILDVSDWQSGDSIPLPRPGELIDVERKITMTRPPENNNERYMWEVGILHSVIRTALWDVEGNCMNQRRIPKTLSYLRLAKERHQATFPLNDDPVTRAAGCPYVQ